MSSIIRDVAHEIGVAPETLRLWLTAGICCEYDSLPQKRIHGRLTKVIDHDQRVKLERFLLFRKFFVLNDRGLKFDTNACLEIQLDIESGNYQVGIDAFDEFLNLLDDLSREAKLHYQALVALHNGDEPIDPLTDDLDE